MKILFSLLWFVLFVAPPPPSFAMVATAKKTTKHAKKNKPSDGTSDDGTNDGFAPATERPIKPLGLDLTCDPSQQKNLDMANGCQDNDCAHPVWADGCEGCMCFNYGNPTHVVSILRSMEIIHGVIPIGETGNATRFLDPIIVIA